MPEGKKHGFHEKWKELPIVLKVLSVIGIVIASVTAISGLCVLVGFIVMWLWNALLPKIFGLPEIGFWEAVGILILSQILFRGFHGSGHMGERGRRHKLRERIKDMDDECVDGPAAGTDGSAAG